MKEERLRNPGKSQVYSRAVLNYSPVPFSAQLQLATIIFPVDLSVGDFLTRKSLTSCLDHKTTSLQFNFEALM